MERMNNTRNCLWSLKSLLLLVVLAFQCVPAFTQNFEDYKNAETLSEKIAISEKLSAEYLEGNLDSLRILGYDLLSYSNANFSKEGIHYAKKQLGGYLIRTANELKGLELLRTAKNYFLEVQDYTNVTEICVEIGIGYHYSKKPDEAIKWYKQSLKYGALSPDPDFKNVGLINLAQAYLEKSNFELANENALNYRDWVLSLGKYQSVANAYAVLGKIALAQKEYDKAVSYFEINENFALKSGSKALRAHALTNIGISKFYLGDTQECLSYFENALQLRLEVKNVSFICDAYLNLGGMYFELGDLEKAEENYQEGLKIAVEFDKFSSQLEMLVAIIEVKNAQNEPVADLEKEYDRVKALYSKKLVEKNAVDVKLEKELNESLRKESEEKPRSKTPFYIGAVIIFFVFLLLAFRKKLV